MNKNVLFAVFLLFAFSMVGVSVSSAQSVLAGGKVVASGFDDGVIPQYIYEGDYDATPVATRNGEEQDPAYIGIIRNREMTFTSVSFFGGTVYADGGWFDSETSPVEVQVLPSRGEEWQTVAEVTDYPTLNATDMDAAVAGHQDVRFDVEFNEPVTGVGIRIAGKGSSGDTPGQSFISLNEILGFGEIGGPADGYEPNRLKGALTFGSTLGGNPDFVLGQAVPEVLIDGHVESYIRASEREEYDFRSFFGFYSANPLTLNSVSFIHGELGDDGWFIDNKPEVEIKTSLTGEWESVGTIDSYPDISIADFPEDLPEDLGTTAWTYEFSAPTEVFGVRISGIGSLVLTDTPFVQVAEIMIDGEGDPEFRGAEGTGRDPDGNAFTPNEDGIIFIEGEYGRVFNEGFKIFPHGEATNGFVNVGTFGPSFNLFSNQGMEFDIELEEGGEYFVFAQGISQNTWGDSLFVTLGDKPPINSDTVGTGDLTWRPESQDASTFTFERDWVTSDTLGQGSQEFYFLDAGEDTLVMALREPRYMLDWLVLTTDPAMAIQAFEPPQSAPPTGVNDFSIYE